MLQLPDEAEVLERIVAWGEAEPSIRAVVLTSTRANPNAATDLLSDYDVIVFTTEPERFGADLSWMTAVGVPLARWGDQNELYGLTTRFRGVVYEHGTKVDFSIWPDALLEEVAARPQLTPNLDVGYRVLLDKGGRTAGWPTPTYRAHVPAPPTREEYEALVEEFWWSSTYVAKALWRGEVVFAKFAFAHDLHDGTLRRMLEWRIELDHDWALKLGACGRGLERLLPAELWSELAATYVGAGIEENWEALFRTAALFRKAATDVAAALGLDYPQQVDDGMTSLLAAVRSLPHKRFDTLRT